MMMMMMKMMKMKVQEEVVKDKKEDFQNQFEGHFFQKNPTLEWLFLHFFQPLQE